MSEPRDYGREIEEALQDAINGAESYASDANAAYECSKEALRKFKKYRDGEVPDQPLESWVEEVDRLLGAKPGLPLLPHERVDRITKLVEEVSPQ